MNIKKTICLFTCFATLLCATACRKTNSDLSSVYSDTSTITEVYHEIIVDNSSENTTTSEITQSSTTSTTSSNDNTSSEDDAPINMEEKYGFSTLKSVEYSCVKDIPTGDAEYKIESVMTDKGSSISYMAEIVSNVSGVTVDGFNITVPYEYRKNNKSVTLTARHKPTGVSIDFTITFDTWELIFEDEFNGTEINTEYWDYCPHYYRDKGYANTWKDEYTFVDGNGHLVSRAYNTGEKNDEGKPICYSGALWSKDLFESSYGYYEVSAKLHHNTGMWGAFWLVTGDMDDPKNCPDDNSGVNGAELDIFESLYNFGGVSHAVHWDGWSGYTKSMPHQGYITDIDTYDNKFHTFALRWSPTEYVFMVDGNVTLRTDAGGICTQPGYINLTTECGTWAGDFTLKKGEYSDMLIDYVRVYTTDSDFKK